jgi:hypothetical protein
MLEVLTSIEHLHYIITIVNSSTFCFLLTNFIVGIKESFLYFIYCSLWQLQSHISRNK